MTARFMTPPANRSSIRAQQQPTQMCAVLEPHAERAACARRHRLMRNPSGDWHVRRHACLSGVIWYTPAITNNVAPAVRLANLHHRRDDQQRREQALKRGGAHAERRPHHQVAGRERVS